MVIWWFSFLLTFDVWNGKEVDAGCVGRQGEGGAVYDGEVVGEGVWFGESEDAESDEERDE